MQISLYNRRKFIKIILLGLFTAGLGTGFLYEYLNMKMLTPFGLLFGFLHGFAFGVFEEFVFIKMNRRRSMALIMAMKSIVYMAIIFVILSVAAYFYRAFYGLEFDSLLAHLRRSSFIIPYVYTLILYDYLIVFLYVDRLLGGGVFFNFSIGRYREPIIEKRVFMFLDLNSSTEIAEMLGRIEYFNFLNDFFHDISEPVLQSSAKIYQTVGDEVVLTWNLKEALKHANCLRAFFRIKDTIEQNRDYYLKRYGVLPSFKAGVHFGDVVSAEIGDLKKSIVYNGDVVNTTARIRSTCSELKKPLLVSAELFDMLDDVKYLAKFGIKTISVGMVELKGKAQPMELMECFRVNEADKILKTAGIEKETS